MRHFYYSILPSGNHNAVACLSEITFLLLATHTFMLQLTETIATHNMFLFVSLSSCLIKFHRKDSCPSVQKNTEKDYQQSSFNKAWKEVELARYHA